MRQNGLSDPSDFKEHWKKSAEERANFYQHGYVNSVDQKKNLAASDRALGEIKLMKQKDYDQLQRKRERIRKERGHGFFED
jgi:LPS O-antigen subunit length determinant protein (WzzB/FepE family)